MKIIFLDGNYLKADEQRLEPFTPGKYRLSGVFETMLGIDGVVLDLKPHLKRLRAGLKFCGIAMPSIDSQCLSDLLMFNRLSVARVRLMVWRDGKQVHVMAMTLGYKIPAQKKYRVCLLKTHRKADKRLANVKSLDYRLFAEAFARAQANGFDEALLLNDQGYIFEASRSNIFWVKDKVLYTPPLSSGCLNGITRQHIIRQARLLNIRFKEVNLTPAALKGADAAFLSNSLMGIKPIAIEKLSLG